MLHFSGGTIDIRLWEDHIDIDRICLQNLVFMAMVFPCIRKFFFSSSFFYMEYTPNSIGEQYITTITIYSCIEILIYSPGAAVSPRSSKEVVTCLLAC